jgi:hypothetical protein
LTLVFNNVNSANGLQQSCFFSFENKVEISVPNAEFFTFNQSGCTFKTGNEEGKIIRKENCRRIDISPSNMKVMPTMSHARFSG